MTLLLHLRIAGVLLLALAAFHFLLPRRFKWDEELARLSLLNRQIFLVHTFFLVLILTMMGVLSLFYGSLLLDDSKLARLVLFGLAIFWIIRLAMQWFVYDRSLWQGNRFNTRVHIAFTALWAYFSLVFSAAFWAQMRSPT